MNERDKIFCEKIIKYNPFDFKHEIINHCRRMEKADVYEWVYNDELKIQQLQQELNRYKSIVDELKKYLKEESKKDDTYFIPYLASIHKTLDKIKELEEKE